jgi:DNA-directed RNA polymerase specialized sigma24 family protein
MNKNGKEEEAIELYRILQNSRSISRIARDFPMFRSDKHDLIHEAWVRCWGQQQVVFGAANQEAILYRIARNIAIDRQRKESRA